MYVIFEVPTTTDFHRKSPTSSYHLIQVLPISITIQPPLTVIASLESKSINAVARMLMHSDALDMGDEKVDWASILNFLNFPDLRMSHAARHLGVIITEE